MAKPVHMGCVTCGHRAQVTVPEAKRLGWSVWLGGAACPPCAEAFKRGLEVLDALAPRRPPPGVLDLLERVQTYEGGPPDLMVTDEQAVEKIAGPDVVERLRRGEVVELEDGRTMRMVREEGDDDDAV